SLQSATILVALPFVVVMLGLCWATVRELREDPGAGPRRHQPLHGLRDAVRKMIGEAMSEGRGDPTAHPRLRRAARSRTQGETGPAGSTDPGPERGPDQTPPDKE
ncbi:BCCT family transporter, partial [Streptomyces sp. CAI-78]|nr:BCCT family transporter [Streptomyces sp. CAI-78]